MTTPDLTSHLSKVRIPQPSDKIYKDECVFSFDTPESDTGLYVCLNTFLGFGKDYLERHYKKTANALYLHIKRYKREIPQEIGEEGPDKKITRLAIGVEGGFHVNSGKKYEYDDHYSVVVLPGHVEIPLPNPDLPEQLLLAVSAIISADSASKMEELQALNATWDGEVRKVSKHADTLIQLDTGKKIPPLGWMCERCNLTENLWLNLTDGSILCGRRFFDGSGGNNHALEHYQSAGYPLAVKLGTITPDAKADVYSYDEDDMVEDPKLTEHLAHFGINVAHMEKTEKSMIELEIDMNQRMGEWITLQESGCNLRPLYGPGYTGMNNLGNSCYLNSVMQLLFTIPDFQKRFVDNANALFDQTSDPVSDFNVQMAKLGLGLLSGKYSVKPGGSDGETDCSDSQPGINPSMFRTLIGKDHAEFSTKRQQDAQEFLLHLINVMERNSRNQTNPAECFKFKVEDRMQCIETGQVKYKYRTEYSLPLPIDMGAAVNKEDVTAYELKKQEASAKGITLNSEEVVRPRIPLSSCLQTFAEPEIIEYFPSGNEKIRVRRTTRLATFPDYIVVQLKKFTIGDDWVPKKLDVAVDMPNEIDVAPLRAHGLQPGEKELPEQPSEVPFQFDGTSMQQLMEMGFQVDACKRSLYHTGNQGVEAASNWLMMHLDDPELNKPFLVPQKNSAVPDNFQPDEMAVGMIMSMGFTLEQSIQALKATNNSVERAVDWIFSHQNELASSGEQMVPTETQYRDGDGKYKLVAFISHMGTSTMVGHYVCHIFRDGHWVIYNDNKVAMSENPPKDLGYLYLYQRM